MMKSFVLGMVLGSIVGVCVASMGSKGKQLLDKAKQAVNL